MMGRKSIKKFKKERSISKHIDREIQKENGTINISRGIHSIHTSRAEKRKNRRTKKMDAIKDSLE